MALGVLLVRYENGPKTKSWWNALLLFMNMDSKNDSIFDEIHRKNPQQIDLVNDYSQQNFMN